ncbi:HNH endonuclease signature motif containing protein [Romboutsia sp. 1001216sp1]|uniref:HNH endonuclease n=1 Tax=unclassified Romboutsia TaxID=2626894 RepID=UPI0018AC5A35|nr:MULTISPECIES: HNH endonuclease signature motif containing protein [unclassified Romboutsia]MDB8794283.1 HNH endonuclease signature motif containing protein [Romboutsia sp. 1001216sp1]MDB8796452.1 HNH endonuclease signature motif containing protein [Romboutsia sp. 1001216sp1]MDB8797795.1 HNH endonuclease signature motif containing protein [Romboutsia sp. 1001216sp1]
MSKILCKHCMKIHDREYECGSKKKHRRMKQQARRNDNRYKVYNDCYNTSRWKKVREQVLKDANYMCEVCMELGKINYTDIQVHHVEKVKNNVERMYDIDNLIVVCREHHNIIENMTADEIINYVENLKLELKR